MNVISSRADHRPEHLRFSREMNRRDGSVLVRSAAVFRSLRVSDIGAALVVIVCGIAAYIAPETILTIKEMWQ